MWTGPHLTRICCSTDVHVDIGHPSDCKCWYHHHPLLMIILILNRTRICMCLVNLSNIVFALSIWFLLKDQNMLFHCEKDRVWYLFCHLNRRKKHAIHSSDTTSSDEERFERRKSKSMARARNRYHVTLGL